MIRLTATDAMFKYADSAIAPMNMGSVQILQKPPGYRGDVLADIRAFVAARIDGLPKLKMRLVDDGIGLPSWVECAHVDIDYHVRRTAVRDASERELFRKLGRLQHAPFDWSRPLFMFYVIEGLPGDRVALMSKYHHALADGKTALRLNRLFSDEGDAGEADAGAHAREPSPGAARRIVAGIAEDLRRTRNSLPAAASLLRAMADKRSVDMIRRLSARPETVFNRPLSASRQFAFRDLPLAPLTAVRRELGLTFVDMGLVLLGGALRRYLDEIDELPAQSLVCNVPVALESGGANAGNAVLAMWVRLGTDIADPRERARIVKSETDASKEYLSGLVQAAGKGRGIALPSVLARVVALGMGSEALSRVYPPPGNVSLSSVPTGSTALRMAAFPVESMYGLPMVLPGQAVSVTISTYADKVVASVLCCEQALPEPERVLDYMADELAGYAAPRARAGAGQRAAAARPRPARPSAGRAGAASRKAKK